MNSSGTNEPDGDQGGDDADKVDAVCVLPETNWSQLEPDQAGSKIPLRLAKLYVAFAKRFTYPFVLTVQHGLIPVGETYKPSEKLFVDLDPDKRQLFLNALKAQLELVMTGNRPCFMLVGSFLVKSLRRMNLPFQMPLAAMSTRQRMHWLETAIGEGSNKLANRMFGRPVMYPSQPAAPQQISGIGH